MCKNNKACTGFTDKRRKLANPPDLPEDDVNNEFPEICFKKGKIRELSNSCLKIITNHYHISMETTTFDWSCKVTWKQSAKNNAW